MRRSAKAEAIRKKSGPIFARAKVRPRLEAAPPKILRSFFTMRIMRVAPEPGRHRFVVVARGRNAGGPVILFRLRSKQPFESRASQLARIPRMISLDLRIPHIGLGCETKNH